MIQTVTGQVRREDLGNVLMHEHFYFGFPGYQGDISLYGFDRDNYFAKLGKLIGEVKRYGVKTIVDATPNDCGRNHVILKESAERAGIHIICATGYYFEGGGAPVYFNMRRGSADAVKEACEIMGHELKVGIGGTDIKAGFIKLASSYNQITDYEKVFFTAACRLAAEDPSVRILTHTEGGTGALLQAEFFLEHGVNPRQVAIGHIDGCTNMDELMSVAEKGFYMSFDRIGMNGFAGTPLDSRKAACVFALISSGYGDKIFLSHDKIFEAGEQGRPFNYPPELAELMSCWNWTGIFRKFIPTLREMGVTGEQVRRLVSDNPADFLDS